MDNCNNISKVPFDPGWNDPPTFSYNEQQRTPSRPRNFLNKRVAFPLSGNQPPPGPLPPVNLPPIPPIPSIQPTTLQPSTLKSSIINNSDVDIDSEGTLIEVKGILLQFLEDSPELGSKADNIKKRINVMEEMWLSGKLNKGVYAQMKQLAEALRDNQPSRADDVHRALMVDHVSVVGTWMPGVKQLVHHCIARSELLAIDKD